ncbi:helix-turn-helix domain-containing protein [Streptomyces aidingensis]|uniref:Helix-turn-helix domain-containing protein n=1 Tax=Streptomyces aidingensis TaxID=910347 RepID=A0A1I1GLL9_9ACTN|nr:helix-turn-helix transcriptional regulator [Streptomyces aidingensis]SFC12391.1 Helix-turn-helix domain-containing protein [Streptomyces aidingensis]
MTIETVSDDASDPSASPLKHFGNEVKLERERLGLSRADLGKEAHCGYSLVAKIESGDRVPPLSFAEACDRVFPHSNGRFVRLWPLVIRYAYPPWFRPYVELEQKATLVRMFNPKLLPGIVQTRDYAEAVLRTARPTNLEDLVTARIERQRILSRDDNPARLWLVLNEAALRNPVGESQLMRAQLDHLRELAETPRHRVQIVPERKVNNLVVSPFGLLSFNEGADVVHVDGFPRGYVLAEPDDVAEAQEAYDLLVAMAAPPDETAELIQSIAKDCYS